MRIKTEQLPATLEKRGLAPIYCISGDEPLQLLESVDTIRRYASSHGVEERIILTVEKDFNWHNLFAAGANLSLFASRRLIELRLDEHKPGREGGAALTEYAAAPPPDNILLLTMARLDKQAQKSVWFKSLEAGGVIIQVWPVEPAQLPGWIMHRIRQYGKTMQREAATLIAQKVEGNLLAARQELEKLCLLVDAPEITLEHVMSAVNDSARYDVFSLIETACLGNGEHTARMLRGLQSEGVEPISIFGALLWELRRMCVMACALESGVPREQVFSEHRIWPQRQTALGKLLQRLPVRRLTPLLGTAYQLDRRLKGAVRGNPWELLEQLLFRLAGIRLASGTVNG
ncbi:MAG: DNA polymerase III subunit delta [Gammaproteobacteria bacterium]|nr:DNA polymerase III subunit delta [Gammaproteobacteria bacterium]